MSKQHDFSLHEADRRRKGAFYTPPVWVAKSQEYLAKTFGDNWQDDYYVWDCAAGTGNLLVGLTNKNNVWASTLDAPDVSTMLDYADHGLNVDKTHIFQFDFLNDEFMPVSKGGKIPDSLYKVIGNPEKQKNLSSISIRRMARQPIRRRYQKPERIKQALQQIMLFAKH